MTTAKNNRESDVLRWRTAKVRKDMSKPSRLSLIFGLYNKSESILDYGCGRGFDAEVLREKGFDAKAWDPYFFPGNPKPESDTVNLGYVLNVIENPKERLATLKEAFALAAKRLVVSVQPADAGCALKEAKPYGDGVLTGTGTFQKFFGREEFGRYLEESTGVKPYLMESGIAVLFKDKAAEKDFAREWASRQQAKTVLHQAIQAAKKSGIGKYIGGAFYVHVSAKGKLPAVLRQMIEKAEDVLNVANAAGIMKVAKGQEGFRYDEAETTLFKLDRDGGFVSFLKYKNFDTDPHPALEKSVLVRFDESLVKGQDFSTRGNRPILHRKETFVAPDHPKYRQFAELTRAEEKAGLYDVDLFRIGTEDGWNRVLAEKGYAPDDFKYKENKKPVISFGYS